jgi:hypothetical protein
VAFSYLHFVPLGFHGEAFKECSINAVTPWFPHKLLHPFFSFTYHAYGALLDFPFSNADGHQHRLAPCLSTYMRYLLYWLAGEIRILTSGIECMHLSSLRHRLLSAFFNPTRLWTYLVKTLEIRHEEKKDHTHFQ